MSEAKRRILVVEDEPTLRELFALRLREQSYEVDSAGDGVSALSLCRQKKPHVILLDVNLPDILGVDIVEKINYSPDEYGTPKIIVITGISYSVKDAEKIWLDEFRVAAFFPKPFDLQELLQKIETVCENLP